MTRKELTEKVYELATELCCAVDCEAEDIGGQRKSLTILQDLGPACDAVANWDNAEAHQST